jgi:hypothetical protein
MKKVLLLSFLLVSCFLTKNLSAWNSYSSNGLFNYYSVRSDDGTFDRVYVTNNSAYVTTITMVLTSSDNVAFQFGYVLSSPGTTQCFGWVGRNNVCCAWDYSCSFQSNP